MSIKRFSHLLALWAAVTIATASAQAQVVLPPVATASAAAAITSPDDDPSFPKPADDADRYRLGPGDVIEVFVWRNAELTTTMPVLPDGTISTPLVDGIVATGKTPVQLARDIEVALSEYVRSPRVSVLVSKTNSSLSQVMVMGGGVDRPQALAYQDGMTVMDALLAVGGLSPFASGNKAKLKRTVDDKVQEIPLKLKNLWEKGDMKQNLPLRPGDIIVIPPTFL